MAKLLISYPQRGDLQANTEQDPPDQSNSEPYTVVLDETVLADIKKNFTGISEVFTVLSLGNTQIGRASTLEAFLGQGNEGSFSSEGKDPGVYVWTRPVPLNNTSLLLVKMWGIDFLNEEDEQLDLITKKVMIALMSISSVCLFCVDKNSTFPSLTALYELYRPIKEKLGLEVSKFIIFLDKEATVKSKAMMRHYTAFTKGEYANISEIIYRGESGMSAACQGKILEIVGNSQSHQTFLRYHRKVMEAIGTTNMINILAIILEQILKIAAMDFDFRNFIGNIPNFTSPEYQTEMLRIEQMKKMSNLVMSADALEFFDEITEESTSYTISQSLLATLQKQYAVEKPIIVMVIIGNQGMGKSTLLNHIVKHHLGCPKLPELFKTGNTETHTTRASQVLSTPLRLGDNQVMLIDLEGLEGMETKSERERILQENLISAILTIASVPCILVRNEVRAIDFMERITSRLSILQNFFGYKLERIHLLFHDKDMKTGSADANSQIDSHILKMNRQYFAGEEVLKLRNKPNFSDESKAEMCEEFLRELMADCDFPKKNHSGSPVPLKQLFVEIKYITEHKNTDVSEIRLTDKEIQELKEFIDNKSLLLRNKFRHIRGNEINGSLESNFNEQYRQFITKCHEELEAFIGNWMRRAIIMLEIEAASHRAEIARIEYCYQSIKNTPSKDLLHKLKEQLNYFYRKSWWLGSFLNEADELKQKLEEVKERYPCSVEKLDPILLKFEKKRNNLRNWFVGNYGFQTVTTVATGGFGLAARGALTTVTAARLAYVAIASGTAVAARLTYGTVSTTLALNEPAIDLMELGLFRTKNAKLNPNAIRILEEVDPYPVLVLLVIAGKNLGASFLLNEFIHCIAPFTPSSIVTFNRSKLTQILHFNYINQRACIIHLRMKKDKTKPKYKMVEKIAVSLIPKASLTCLFLNSPSEYANDIIAKAFPPPKVSGYKEYNQRFSPRVAAIYPENREDIDFLARLSELERRGVQNVRIRVGDFSDQTMNRVLIDVKNEFERSTPLGSQTLLEALKFDEPAKG